MLDRFKRQRFLKPIPAGNVNLLPPLRCTYPPDGFFAKIILGSGKLKSWLDLHHSMCSINTALPAFYRLWRHIYDLYWDMRTEKSPVRARRTPLKLRYSVWLWTSRFTPHCHSSPSSKLYVMYDRRQFYDNQLLAPINGTCMLTRVLRLQWNKWA